MFIGDYIRRRREELGLTQLELSKKLGYKDDSTVAKVEAGKNDISSEKIKLYAAALETSVAYLMGWTPDPDETIPIEEGMSKQSIERLREYAELLKKAERKDNNVES